jgi:hypothetical protein
MTENTRDKSPQKIKSARICQSKTTRKEIAPAISRKKFLLLHLNQQITACSKWWVVIGERKIAKNAAGCRQHF